MTPRPFPEVDSIRVPPPRARRLVEPLLTIALAGVLALGLGLWWRLTAPPESTAVVVPAPNVVQELQIPAIETVVVIALRTPTPSITPNPTATDPPWPTSPPTALDLYGPCHLDQQPGSYCVPMPPTMPPVPATLVPTCTAGYYPSFCQWPGTPIPTKEDA